MTESRSRPNFDAVFLAALIALVYTVAWPPLYMRDGYIYHLLGRDLLANTNPHHLLWNLVESALYRMRSVSGAPSVRPFQLFGMLCSLLACVLLHHQLLRLSTPRTVAFAAALFVAFTQWVWFMSFQNQPYAPMFLLFVAMLGCFRTPDGTMPTGWRFAGAAAAAVGIVMLQQAAVMIVIGIAVCFLVLDGWRRVLAWTAATAIPTAVLYVTVAALRGVRSPSAFVQWTSSYLRSQHGLQTRFPDSAVQGVMGVISAFVNQEPFKDLVVSDWSPSGILWFYGLVGIAIVVALVTLAVRRPRHSHAYAPPARALRWTCVASIVSWGVFCFLWEPTNYYWFILLAPAFLYAAPTIHPSSRGARAAAAALGVATLWNLYANHYLDAAGAGRAPEPQLRVIAQHVRPNDLLWVVDLGWSGDVDYDLLSSALAMEQGPAVRSVSEVVGRSPNAAAWQKAFEATSDSVVARGGRLFLSGRVFLPETFERTWEESPFSDYGVERRYPIDWATLGRDLPAFVSRGYIVAPAGFSIGSDTIRALTPRQREFPLRDR